MRQLKHYVGKRINLDGVEGTVRPPSEPDSHYRFVWGEGSELRARPISRRLITPTRENPEHGWCEFKTKRERLSGLYRQETVLGHFF